MSTTEAIVFPEEIKSQIALLNRAFEAAAAQFPPGTVDSHPAWVCSPQEDGTFDIKIVIKYDPSGVPKVRS